MNWFTGLVAYIVLWWLALFAVLPLKVKVPDEVPPGHATSAPENPHLLFKAGLTSLIAAVLWIVFYAIVVIDVFNLKDRF